MENTGHITVFKSKIHRATITHADLDYEGSLSIDTDLMEAANILEYEQVHVWNVTQGSRLTTYAIAAPAGSGVICANGAAAHHNNPGDLIIIATFMTGNFYAGSFTPKVVQVDASNKMMGTLQEVGGPVRR